MLFKLKCFFIHIKNNYHKTFDYFIKKKHSILLDSFIYNN